MGAYFTLFIGAVLINNFVLTKFLGLCIFFGVSKNLNASIGMGFAVTSVITLSTILAWKWGKTIPSKLKSMHILEMVTCISFSVKWI